MPRDREGGMQTITMDQALAVRYRFVASLSAEECVPLRCCQLALIAPRLVQQLCKSNYSSTLHTNLGFGKSCVRCFSLVDSVHCPRDKTEHQKNGEFSC